MIRYRIDPRVSARVDASDVIQEAYVEVSERLDDYLDGEDMPFFLWVRFIAGQKLLQVHRRHVRAGVRDVRREHPLPEGLGPGVSSVVFANALLDRSPTPSKVVARSEERQRLEHALDSMDEVDCEVLALRHFEGLTNGEAARVLGISDSAASQRYSRRTTPCGKERPRISLRGVVVRWGRYWIGESRRVWRKS